MIIDNQYDYIQKNLNNGDEIFACSPISIKIGPTPGILSLKDFHHRWPNKTFPPKHEMDHPIWYFVPYKPNTKEPDWYKATQLDNRRFATTENECLYLHQKLMELRINELQNQINKIHAYLNKTTIQTTTLKGDDSDDSNTEL